MDKYEIIKDYSETSFKETTGVMPETFNIMLDIVKEAYANKHKNRGRHSKLSCENMLLMMLEYYKEYRTLQCIGSSYGLHKTNVGETIRWIEKALLDSGKFSLPSKRKLVQVDSPIQEDSPKIIVVDTTETPIQRPICPKKQKKYYSGKKRGIQ